MDWVSKCTYGGIKKENKGTMIIIFNLIDGTIQIFPKIQDSKVKSVRESKETNRKSKRKAKKTHSKPQETGSKKETGKATKYKIIGKKGGHCIRFLHPPKRRKQVRSMRKSK